MPQLRSTAAAFAIALATPALGLAQDSSLWRQSQQGYAPQPLTLENSSLMYQKPEPVKVLQMHDIVTVVININQRLLSEGDSENRVRASYIARLTDWVHFDGNSLRPNPQSQGDQTIGTTLNSQRRAESDLETRNTVTFTIAARVIDVRPNGNLVIEAQQTLHNNEEVWETKLSGIIRREDISPDNKIESEDIADLRVVKHELGQVRDGYRRGWFSRWFDSIQPF
jgi:flagellar L-ring protein precursor FlgH